MKTFPSHSPIRNVQLHYRPREMVLLKGLVTEYSEYTIFEKPTYMNHS